MSVIQLNTSLHSEFFSQNRIDPITREPFKEGDRIMLCASCKCAFLEDTWRNIGNTHCSQTSTLATIPTNEFTNLLLTPTILDFTAYPNIAYEGTPIKLSWSVQNSRICEIDNSIGNVSSHDIVEIMPNGINEKTYTLTAIGRLRKVKKQVKVRIIPLPTVQHFNLPTLFQKEIYSVPRINIPTLPNLKVPQYNMNLTLSEFPQIGMSIPKIQAIYFKLNPLPNFDFKIGDSINLLKKIIADF